MRRWRRWEVRRVSGVLGLLYYGILLLLREDIFAVVSKVPNMTDGKTYYNVSIACKEGVPHFKPELPGNAVFEKGELFKDFLLCKCMNSFPSSSLLPSSLLPLLHIVGV